MIQGILRSETMLFGILFVIVISLCACSSTNSVLSTDYGRINEGLKGREVEIEVDGRSAPARDVTISRDSVSWIDPRSEKRFRAGTRQLNKIVDKNHALGALEGLGFGVAIGGGVGTIVGASLNIQGTAESGSQTSGFGALVGLVLGGGAGAIAGSVTGLYAGHSFIYAFPMDERSDSVRNGK
jgi:hypothetical protein